MKKIVPRKTRFGVWRGMIGDAWIGRHPLQLRYVCRLLRPAGHKRKGRERVLPALC